MGGAYWYRSFRNRAGPNVFFDTTAIFPDSVARGLARGRGNPEQNAFNYPAYDEE